MNHMFWVWLGYTIVIVLSTGLLVGIVADRRGFIRGKRVGRRDARNRLRQQIKDHTERIGL